MDIGSIQIIFSSKHFGQGKSVTALSYTRPEFEQPRRLVIDLEMRNSRYKSPDGVDHPSQLMFAYDDFEDVYGEITADTLIALYQAIREKTLPYEVIIVDNVALLQEEIKMVVEDKARAIKVAKAMRGVYSENRLFLDYKFKPTDMGGIYRLIKSILKALLRACKRGGVDIITTTESRNVWKDYGKRGQRVLGQTAKALDPWIQFADAVFMLSREKGNRDEGTAQIVDAPFAKIDTFNPKNSLPGLKPKFRFTDWGIFWEMVNSRQITTQEELDEVEVEQSEFSEEAATGPVDLMDAKRVLVEEAKKVGILADGGIDKLKLVLAEADLTSDDAFAKHKECLKVIRAWKKAA